MHAALVGRYNAVSSILGHDILVDTGVGSYNSYEMLLMDEDLRCYESPLLHIMDLGNFGPLGTFCTESIYMQLTVCACNLGANHNYLHI